MIASRLIILVVVLALSAAYLSCSDCDTGVGVGSTEEPYATASNQAGLQRDMPGQVRKGMCLFFADDTGSILYSEYAVSREEVEYLLSRHRKNALPVVDIYEVFDRETIVDIVDVFYKATPGLGSISMIGIVSTFEECVADCLGDDPSWGRIKKCHALCSEDHDPKRE